MKARKVAVWLVTVMVVVAAGSVANAKTKELNGALWKAANKGDLNQVKTLLERGVNVNFVQKEGHSTALMWAAYNKHFDIVKYLVENGANVYLVNSSGNSETNCRIRSQFTTKKSLEPSSNRKSILVQIQFGKNRNNWLFKRGRGLEGAG